MVKNIDEKSAAAKMPPRPENSHKGSFGRILNIAGSINYTGAAYLSSISALKTGAGFVNLACPDVIHPIIAGMAPEITFKPLKSNNGAIAADNDIEDLNKYNVISIGCGLTNTKETQKFFFKVLEKITPEQKLIIDADGINILASASPQPLAGGENADGRNEVSPVSESRSDGLNTVITPHPKELAGLLDVKTEDIVNNREKYALEASNKYGCITVLKGYNSIITDGKEIYINASGSSALAKAGTGDVLTGIISGLAAQKMNLFDAAILGVYLHGLSGDIAAKDLTEYCVLASDVIHYIPEAVKQILTVR